MPLPWLRVAPIVLATAFLAAYLPDLGHGFVKDDFAWILHSRVRDLTSLSRVLFTAPDFYRPVVALTFTVNEWVFGLWPFGYGLTNLLLAGACAWAVAKLASTLGLSRAASLMTAAVWAFNFHGINMALLWISGRTALCLTLFAVLAARAAVQNRRGQVFVWSLLAMLSKEEAVLLPVVCGMMAVGARQRAWPRGRVMFEQGWRGAWPALAASTVYLVLRTQAGAMTPATAPAHYQLTFSPALLLQNAVQYLDRSSTLAALCVIVLLAAVNRRPRLDAPTRVLIVKSLAWIAMALAVTVWLPVRSSLYAVWPGVGAALAAAAIAGAVWPLASPHRIARIGVVAVLLPFLLWPVYRSRNVRWVELADLTRDTLAAIRREAPQLPPGSFVVLTDDRSTRASFSNAFGTLFPETAELVFDKRLTLWIEPPPDELSAAARPDRPIGAEFVLRSSRISRVK